MRIAFLSASVCSLNQLEDPLVIRLPLLRSFIVIFNAIKSISGSVKVWDPRQKDIPVANMEPAVGEQKRDCWSVAFGMLFSNEIIF